MTILDIPYVSQEDEGAEFDGKEIYNDCGPTCGTMLIRAYTPQKAFTVNEFYNEMGFKKDQFTKNNHIMNVLEKHGISSSWSKSLKLSDLETFISQKRPPITLINYKALRENGIKTYNSKATFHFVVVVGVDDTFVYLNDPLWPGTRGKNLKIPRDIWLKAWGGKNFLNGKGEQINSQFQALIPTDPLDAEEMKPPEGSIRMKVVFKDFMNVRTGPGTNNSRKESTIPSGAYVTILETKKMGEDVWGKLGEDEWIAIYLSGDTYLEPVAPAVDDPEDKSTMDQKEEKSEDNEMSVKQTVNAGVESKDDPSVETQNMDDLSLGAVMDELRAIKAILMDMKKNMTSGNLKDNNQTEDEFTPEDPITNIPQDPEFPEDPITPQEPEINYVEAFTDKQNGLVNLSFIKTYNGKIPVFEFYPGDSSSPSDRIQVRTGEKLKVIPDSRTVGDADRKFWKLDKNEYIPKTKKSAKIPAGIDIYIEEKFITSYLEKI